MMESSLSAPPNVNMNKRRQSSSSAHGHCYRQDSPDRIHTPHNAGQVPPDHSHNEEEIHLFLNALGLCYEEF